MAIYNNKLHVISGVAGIEDTLDSDAVDKSLSAAKGKELKKMVEDCVTADTLDATRAEITKTLNRLEKSIQSNANEIADLKKEGDR